MSGCYCCPGNLAGHMILYRLTKAFQARSFLIVSFSLDKQFDLFQIWIMHMTKDAQNTFNSECRWK